MDRLAYTQAFQQLLVEYNALPNPPAQPSQEQLIAWQDELEPLLDDLLQRLTALRSSAPATGDVLLIEALVHAKRANIYLNRRRLADARVALARASGEPDPGELAERARLAVLVADEYERIRAALAGALAEADAFRQQREVQLVQGVIFAQSAIVQDRAIDVTRQQGDEMAFDPGALRALLDDAQVLIEAYLSATPRENGLEWVRGRFYLGVVEYRRALKVRQPGEAYFTEVDPARTDVFDRAREIFMELGDADGVYQVLRPTADDEAFARSPAGEAYATSSFSLQAAYTVQDVARYYAASANLYLGLMAAIDPDFGASPEDLRSKIEAARGYLNQALEYDTVYLDGAPPPAEADPPPAATQPAPAPGSSFSLTNGTIPSSRQSVLAQLETAMETPQRQPLNDLTLSFGVGYLYDTNPTLLGRGTLQAREIAGESDSRLPAVMRFSYVADLDVLDPGNEALRKWQVLLEGRVSSIWGRDIPEFNQQFYGGTVNLRYELMGPDQVDSVDGLYFHVRYDHDNIFLDNEAFLVLNRVRPMFQGVFWDGLLDTSVFFGYENRSYSESLADARFSRTGDYFTVGADARLDLGEWVGGERLWGPEFNWGPYAPRADDPRFERPLRAQMGYEFLTTSTLGDEFDYSSHLLTAGVVTPLPWGVDFAVTGLWEWQDYRQNSLIDRQRRRREDFVQEYGFRFERPFFVSEYESDFEFSRPLNLQRLILTPYVDIRFVINDSNGVDRLGQQPFEYNRTMYGVGLRVDLN